MFCVEVEVEGLCRCRMDECGDCVKISLMNCMERMVVELLGGEEKDLCPLWVETNMRPDRIINVKVRFCIECMKEPREPSIEQLMKLYRWLGAGCVIMKSWRVLSRPVFNKTAQTLIVPMDKEGNTITVSYANCEAE